MTLRRIRRAVALVFVLTLCILRYWLARLRGPMTLERRAMWLQACARMILRSLGIGYEVEGQPPTRGLVVSNHLSYLDVIIISAVMPCFFVAKAEIDGWPYFGKAARTGGTIFVDRSGQASAMSVAEQTLSGSVCRFRFLCCCFPRARAPTGRSFCAFIPA